ncbi:MAG TPA: MmgE/PrpD family protein [Alphaproteobacteria bacterium]|nr:MmgE/PrpD family protein [Alphaproteobacteria bacterium]HJM48761.1 MmgE/PrpD family protein [Alphaproteobacteria bacterium]
MATVSQTLAAWIAEAEVPPAQREKSTLRVLDTIGLVAAALNTPQAEAVTDFAAAQGGQAEAGLVGGRRLPAALAALVQGTLAHSFDYDDTFADSVVHPGSVVVPSALAVAEAASADGGAVLDAVAIGYEVAARLGAVAGRGLHARGFHASGVIGPLAAAAVAARLGGLTADQAAQALGLAGSMSGGLLAFIDDGSWSKWLHLGWAAQGGITAAGLAARGFRGPASVLEGSHGLFAAHIGSGQGVEDVCQELGREWRGDAALFKTYPCAHVIQPFLDSAIAARAEEGLTPDAITEATCTLAPWAVAIVAEPRPPKLVPAGPLEAIGSLPFMVAAALADGRVDLDTLAPESLVRPDLLTLAARVEHQADAALGQGFDGRLEIMAGRRLHYEVKAQAATPEGLRDKFRQNAGRNFAAPTVAAIESAVDGLVADGFAPLWQACASLPGADSE